MKKYKRITVLKPDHLGDLVLSIPAINKLIEFSSELELYVHPSVKFLAEFLFPQIQIHTISFFHLSKNSQFESKGYEGYIEAFNQSDLFVALRNDAIINEQIVEKIHVPVVQIQNSMSIHESELHKQALKDKIENYDQFDYFFDFQKKVNQAFSDIKKVGFVVSAGFYNNSLSVGQWYGLANEIKRKYNSEIFLIGGPQEVAILNVLKHLLSLEQKNIIIGSKDLVGFLESISILDYVVATDSGTSHLVSLAKIPQISIFGPSPFLRYSPIGKDNFVVTKNLNCSPCSQFVQKEVNLCLSRECMSGDWWPSIASRVSYFESVKANF